MPSIYEREKALKLFGEFNYRLVLELTSRPDVLRPVILVEGHVKPLHLQCLVRHRDVTCGHQLRNAEHLLKSMEMVHRRRHEILMDLVVSARHHVDVLADAGLLFLQMALEEVLDGAIEVSR